MSNKVDWNSLPIPPEDATHYHPNSQYWYKVDKDGNKLSSWIEDLEENKYPSSKNWLHNYGSDCVPIPSSYWRTLSVKEIADKNIIKKGVKVKINGHEATVTYSYNEGDYGFNTTHIDFRIVSHSDVWDENFHIELLIERKQETQEIKDMNDKFDVNQLKTGMRITFADRKDKYVYFADVTTSYPRTEGVCAVVEGETRSWERLVESYGEIIKVEIPEHPYTLLGKQGYGYKPYWEKPVVSPEQLAYNEALASLEKANAQFLEAKAAVEKLKPKA